MTALHDHAAPSLRWSTPAKPEVRAGGFRGRAGEAGRELLLMAALFVLYEAGRAVAAGHVARAFDNASSVWHVERWLRLPSESALQAPFVGHDDLSEAVNTFYASAHFPVTVGVLVALWYFRPDHYLWTRRAMALVTFSALVIHVTLPVAPPRMLSSVGMIDLAHLYGPAVYAPTSDAGLSDQFAAMPSLHVGWALLVAIAGYRALEGRWRGLLFLYPAVTTYVVVVTGNHYWLDALAGALLVAVFTTIRLPWADPEPDPVVSRASSDVIVLPDR